MQSIFHLASYMKCHSSLRTIKQNNSLLLVKNKCGCLILLVSNNCSEVAWFHSTSIFQRLYFYLILDCLIIYFQCASYTFSWLANIARLMEHQTDDYRTVKWNSLVSCFHIETDPVFYSRIDHGVWYNSLLENAYEFEFFAITKNKLFKFFFQKLGIFEFNLSKYVNVVVLLLLIASFFLRLPMPLRLVEFHFQFQFHFFEHKVNCVFFPFFLFLIWFSRSW